MINKVINVNENHPMHDKLMNMMNNTTDENLIIVARSYKNRKDDAIEPIEVKNGIYFYVAYNLDGALAFPAEVTPRQIAIAKANMAEKAKLGTMLDAQLTVAGFGDFMKHVDEFTAWDEPMIIFTNDELANGAGILLNKYVLSAIKEKLGDFYILPSSIHELLIVPAHMMSILDATEMVVNANETAVTDDVYLADRAFHIDEWI